tara:strand:+ start:816 stop:1535 length:720 start_codon:yes stop_codon:yes gene_type:complete
VTLPSNLEAAATILLAVDTNHWPDKFILFLILVASLSVHEWAHAFTADKLNDPLPRSEGRVTLNPISHIDPIGTLLIPLLVLFLSPGFAVIGWGKPVRVSLPNEKSKVRDDLLITAAGPFSNLLIALSTACLSGIAFGLGLENEKLLDLASTVIWINCMLFIFNLIPIPPLDGSHFLKHILRMSEQTFAKLSSYGFIMLIVLVNLPFFGKAFGTAISFSSSKFGELALILKEMLAKVSS